MHLVRLFVKVKAVDRPVSFYCISLLLGYYFRVKDDEFVDTSNAEACRQFFIYLATVGFVDSHVLHGGVVEIGFLLQTR